MYLLWLCAVDVTMYLLLTVCSWCDCEHVFVVDCVQSMCPCSDHRRWADHTEEQQDWGWAHECVCHECFRALCAGESIFIGSKIHSWSQERGCLMLAFFLMQDKQPLFTLNCTWLHEWDTVVGHGILLLFSILLMPLPQISLPLVPCSLS